MNEGYPWKKKLFIEQGRAQLEKLTLAPWASRRRQELLELRDGMNPTIEELTARRRASSQKATRGSATDEVERRGLDWASRSLKREFDRADIVRDARYATYQKLVAQGRMWDTCYLASLRLVAGCRPCA
jgi:hypothetical protein